MATIQHAVAMAIITPPVTDSGRTTALESRYALSANWPRLWHQLAASSKYTGLLYAVTINMASAVLMFDAHELLLYRRSIMGCLHDPTNVQQMCSKYTC